MQFVRQVGRKKIHAVKRLVLPDVDETRIAQTYCGLQMAGVDPHYFGEISKHTSVLCQNCVSLIEWRSKEG